MIMRIWIDNEDEDHNERKGKLEENQYQLSMDDMHDQLFN